MPPRVSHLRPLAGVFWHVHGEVGARTEAQVAAAAQERQRRVVQAEVAPLRRRVRRLRQRGDRRLLPRAIEGSLRKPKTERSNHL